MPQLADYGTIIAQFLPIVAMIAIFYFLLIRPQRKRDKAEKAMRNSITVGDEISTIGGIIGRVVSVKDDIFIIESTAERTKIKLHRWAIRGKEEAIPATDAKKEKKVTE